MTSNNEIPLPIMRAALDEVYRIAEGFYLMSGGTIPEGCSFSRSLGELAEHCYSCASIFYLNELNRCDSTA